MRAEFPSLLFLLAIFCTAASSIQGMKRTVLVHFSNETETLRLRILSDLSGTYGELERSLTEQLAAVEISRIEFYSDSEGFFKVYNSDEAVTNRFISCYVTVRSVSMEHQAQIRGRAFNIDDGFYISGREIRITDGNNRSLGTGLNTWDGAVVLAKYLELNPGIVAGKRVLELGSGTGVAGLAAVLLGARLCALTDLPYALENLVLNINNNIKDPSVYDRVIARALDWGDSSTYIFPADAEALPAAEGRQPWDVIIGADVVWLEELVPLLVQALTALTGESTIVILSHQRRSVHTDSLLFGLLEKEFTINTVDRSLLHPEFSSELINIYQGRKIHR